MISEAPPFWWEKADWRAWLLWPASLAYGAVSGRLMASARPAPLDVPVLCVGNLTVGGAGKTPAALAIAAAVRAAGLHPGFLSRGHGGVLEKATLVDPHHHGAAIVGDEPLLLAGAAPTAVGADRKAAAALLVAAGCDFIIMDDGFQSRRVLFDLALVVVDAAHGLGNGFVIPAGPVRAPLGIQARFADALLKVGSGEAADSSVRLLARAGRPVHEAVLAPLAPARIKGQRLYAFAGIGHPDKFFRTLDEAGAELAGTRRFPDHHAFTDEDCTEILAAAEALGARPATTAKDAVRLGHGAGKAAELAGQALVVEVEMRFEDESAPAKIVAETRERFRRRRLSARPASAAQ